jgi:hypothetical protein
MGSNNPANFTRSAFVISVSFGLRQQNGSQFQGAIVTGERSGNTAAYFHLLLKRMRHSP